MDHRRWASIEPGDGPGANQGWLLVGGDQRGANALLIGEKGEIIVGTEHRNVLRWSALGTAHYGSDETLGRRDEYILSLLKSKGGALWIGGSWGLHEFKGEKRVPNEKFIEAFAPGQDSVASLLQTVDETIWVGCFSGALRVIQDGKMETLSRPGDSAIFDLETDAQGNIWAATFREGVLKVDPNRTFQTIGRDKGVPEASLTVLYHDDQKMMWLGSDGDGLHFWRDESFHHVETAGEGELGNVLQIQEDSDGWLWLGTTRGICGIEVSKIRKGEAVSPGEILWLGSEDGMANEQCTRMKAVKDGSGRLYFGTMDGFVSFDPHEIKRSSLQPKVVIEEIQVEKMRPTQISVGEQRFEIPPGARFAARFTGLPPERAESMHFRYRLAGLKSTWTELSNRRFIDFPYTPPGDYRLEVQSGARGTWSPGTAALALHVRPFYWQTWWFHLALSILAVLGVVILMKSLERKRMRQVLSAIERTQAVNQERDRISRDLHDGLGAGLTQANILVQEWANQDSPEFADRLKDRLRALSRELDNSVWVTNPSHDRLSAVCDYLAGYAQNWFQGTGVRCFLDLPKKIPEIQISPDIRHHLFQGVKECLNNVIKHAAATEVNFSMQTSETKLSLTIRDNGRGFDRDEVSKKGRNGLKNIHQRLGQVHGKAEFRSSPEGTTTELTLPYSAR